MTVILPCIPDPTDIVIQGEQIIPVAFPDMTIPMACIQLLEGWQPLSEVGTKPIPGALVGQSDWFGILPRTIGPMAFGQAGRIDMLDIGIPNFQSPNIDPIQAWLNAPFPIDITGMWFDLTPDMLGAFEATNATVFPIQQPDDTPVVIIPRGAVFRSGLIKRMTAPVLPPSVGQHLMEYYTESTQRYFVTGVTRNSTGATLGGCRVVLFEASKIVASADQYANPFVAETVSDASGNFSFQVDDLGPYQIIAYLDGSPDVAGITVNEVVPVVV